MSKSLAVGWVVFNRILPIESRLGPRWLQGGLPTGISISIGVIAAWPPEGLVRSPNRTWISRGHLRHLELDLFRRLLTLMNRVLIDCSAVSVPSLKTAAVSISPSDNRDLADNGPLTAS